MKNFAILFLLFLSLSSFSQMEKINKISFDYSSSNTINSSITIEIKKRSSNKYILWLDTYNNFKRKRLRKEDFMLSPIFNTTFSKI